MTTIAKLALEISMNASKLKSDLSNSESSIRRFASRSQSIMSGVGSAIKSAMKVAAGAIAVASAAFVAGVVVINRYAESIDQLAKSADMLGVLPNKLQEINYAAKMAGVSSGEVATALQRMSVSVANAAQGTGPAVDALNALGLSAKELSRMSPDEQMRRIGNEINKITNQGDRLKATIDIFGRSGGNLVNLFASDMAGLSAEFNDLGLGISRSQAAMVEMYNDTRSKLGELKDGFFNQLTVRVAPALEQIYLYIIELVKEFGGMDTVAQRVANSMLNFVSSGIRGIVSFVGTIGGIETGFLRVQKVINDTIGVLGNMVNMITPSEWARKFGINFEPTAIARSTDAAAMRSGEISQKIRESEDRFDFSGMEQRAEALISRIRQGLDGESLSGEVPATDRNTEATNQNTSAIADLKASLTGEKPAASGGAAWQKIFGTDENKGEDNREITDTFKQAAINLKRSLDGGGNTREIAERLETAKRMLDAAAGRGPGGVTFGSERSADIAGMTEVLEQLKSLIPASVKADVEQGGDSGEGNKISDVVTETRSVRDTLDNKINELINTQTELFGPDKWDRLIEAVSGGEMEQVGTIEINVKSDTGTLSGELMGEPKFLKSLKQFVEKHAQDVARQVA